MIDDLPEPTLGPARLERQWTNVRDRVGAGRPAPTWRGPAIGVLTLTVCVLLAWRLAPRDEAPVLAAGSAVETTERAMRVALEEGSLIDLGPASRVALESATAEDVAVSLDRGRASFDVARRPSRSFRVQTTTASGDDVEVRVVGTAFTVEHDEDGSVSVEVERGIVEVRSGGEIVRLTAGGSWRSHGSAADSGAEAAEGSADAPEGFEGPTEPLAATVEGSPGRSGGSTTEGGESSSPGALARRPRGRGESSETPDARALFEQAREARQAGSIAEAARLYGELITEHDDDPRADVAAFELARLRMDHLDDPRGALRALDRALAGGGAFREDAMARRAVLLDRLGRDAECRSARDAYLATFGAGVHRAEVGELCP